MRLHEQVTAVMKELQAVQSIHSSDRADICQAVLENVVFVDRAVDAVSVKRANDAGGGDALCSFAVYEASAKTALADITIAVQSFEEEDDFLNVETPLVVVVEHDEGYIGQAFNGQLISSVIRVKKAPFKPNVASFDSVLEAHEEDFRGRMEISGIADQPHQLTVNVQAGFGIASSHHHNSSISSASQEGSVSANLISSWSGIENIRALYCKPPSNSSSLVCIGEGSDDLDFHLGSSLARSSSVKSMKPSLSYDGVLEQLGECEYFVV